jgi:hypothetical protein
MNASRLYEAGTQRSKAGFRGVVASFDIAEKRCADRRQKKLKK